MSSAEDGSASIVKVAELAKQLTENGWNDVRHDCYVRGTSQEHSIVRCLTEEAFNSFFIG